MYVGLESLRSKYQNCDRLTYNFLHEFDAVHNPGFLMRVYKLWLRL